jgi:hypothetical protein
MGWFPLKRPNDDLFLAAHIAVAQLLESDDYVWQTNGNRLLGQSGRGDTLVLDSRSSYALIDRCIVDRNVCVRFLCSTLVEVEEQVWLPTHFEIRIHRHTGTCSGLVGTAAYERTLRCDNDAAHEPWQEIPGLATIQPDGSVAQSVPGGLEMLDDLAAGWPSVEPGNVVGWFHWLAMVAGVVAVTIGIGLGRKRSHTGVHP